MILAASLILATISTGVVQASGIATMPVTDEEPPTLNDRGGRGDSMLERALRREVKINESLSTLLKKADETVIRLKGAISKGQANNRDVSMLENELEKLNGQLIIARAAHDRAAKLLSNPAGFDADGKVINREVAIESIQKIHQVQQDVRQTIGDALRNALRAFRDQCQDESGDK